MPKGAARHLQNDGRWVSASPLVSLFYYCGRRPALSALEPRDQRHVAIAGMEKEFLCAAARRVGKAMGIAGFDLSSVTLPSPSPFYSVLEIEVQ